MCGRVAYMGNQEASKVCMTRHHRKDSAVRSKAYCTDLLCRVNEIPQRVEKGLESNEKIKYLACGINNARNVPYWGRGFIFLGAPEGALKLKEISYVNTEGYPASAMKLGIITLIDKKIPVIPLQLLASHEDVL